MIKLIREEGHHEKFFIGSLRIGAGVCEIILPPEPLPSFLGLFPSRIDDGA